MRKAGLALVFSLFVLVFGQGTPHTFTGHVFNGCGTPPAPSCLTFIAYVEGSVDTVRYPGDPRATYSPELGGAWTVTLDATALENGDLFVIVFANICSSTAGMDTATVDLSGPVQDLGTTYLSAMGCGEGGKKPALSLSVTPAVSKEGFLIEVLGEGFVEVEAFNILGQSLGKLYVGRCPNGASFVWRPEDVSGGVYFIKATDGKNVLVRKVYFVP